MTRLVSTFALVVLSAACAEDPAISGQDCVPGELQCSGNTLQVCEDGEFIDSEDCSADDLLCISDVGCRRCSPEKTFCCDELNSARFSGCTPGLDVLLCDAEGMAASVTSTCSTENAETCVPGEDAICENACAVAARNQSYVGCEYYAVDMDNYAGNEGSAAEQQFAFVLSNPSRLIAEVTVEVNHAKPGEPLDLEVIREFVVPPQELYKVDDLESREVDGSPPGTYDQGTDTALTSQAFRIRSTAPLIAYQFNPFQRYDVFSNDASLLVPTTAVGTIDEDEGTTTGSSYLVMGWPQLLAETQNPETNAGIDLPALLTIVGTTPDTEVIIQTTANIIGSPDVPETSAGGQFSMTLGPFDVLNLESNGFGADFTGTMVSSNAPVLAFSGNECVDVPRYGNRLSRQCCCDHLEEQLFPLQTFGETFIAVQTPLRSHALADAGSRVTRLPVEKEYWKLLTTGEFTTCKTNLPPPNDELTLQSGLPREIEATQDFTIECGRSVVAGQFVASQHVVVGPDNNQEPAGDPAFMILPPVEQYRKEYLFLVPDKYSFDYIMVAAPSGSTVWFDGSSVDDFPYCERKHIGAVTLGGRETDFDSIKCALSAPTINPNLPSPDNVSPGIQNDGVHSLRADEPVGLMVYGFDAFVSYGYPGGSDLEAINIE